MPPKKKKPLLRDEDLKDTIELVTKCWPDQTITPSMIRTPTRGFVLQFYGNCVDELEEIVSRATRSSPLPGPSGTCEEILFIKLLRIPVLMNADFQLADLYEFDPFRVNTHIHILSHFVFFTKNIMSKGISICDKVFDAKEELKQNKEDIEKLKDKKLQNQLALTELNELNVDLKKEANAILPKYHEVMKLIDQLEEKNKNKIFEIEKLKEQLKNYEEEIQKLVKTKQELRSQVITESEHNMLRNKLNSLISEEKDLEDIDENNFLLEQKQNIGHLQMCRAKLGQLELSSDIFKLFEWRHQLKGKMQSLQDLVYLQGTKGAELKTIQDQIEEKRACREQENKNLKLLQKVTNDGQLKLTELRKKREEINKDSPALCEKIRWLERIEEAFRKVKEDVEQKYDMICDIEEDVMNKFQNFVSETNLKLS